MMKKVLKDFLKKLIQISKDTDSDEQGFYTYSGESFKKTKRYTGHLVNSGWIERKNCYGVLKFRLLFQVTDVDKFYREKKKKRMQYKQSTSTDRRAEYRELLLDKRWKEKRQHILDTKGHVCSMCGATEQLQVHHLRYLPNHKHWEYDDKDLVVLCKKCHYKVHHQVS